MRSPRSVRPPFALLAAFVCAAPLAAQTLDTETIVSGLLRPTWAGSPPGDERIFFTEQHTGAVRIVDGSGTLLGTPFLDVGTVLTGGEQGLLGMAFHPKFKQNGHVFVNYTVDGPTLGGDTVVERWTVSDGDPNVADPASRLEFLRVAQPFSNHNAGDLAFSPLDGYLYIALGDGGSGNDPGCRAQNPAELLGKMLRIDVDAPDAGAGTSYSIPPTNPFVGEPGYREEIWALGLRNPFRFSFDQLTGDLYIGDVGQGSREEVSFEPALAGGRNYGWPVQEAELCSNSNFNNCVGILDPDPAACFDAAYTDPVFAYNTGAGPGSGARAIIGGHVYRGCKIPELQGTYLFGDNTDNTTFFYFSFELVDGVVTDFANRGVELQDAGARPSDFGVDGEGELLIVHLGPGGAGAISRVVAARPPAIADCDGNGQDDACEIATYPWADLDGSGTVDACESFSADTDHLCVGVGGTQEWRLHAGPAFAGDGYLVLGSFSGTSPGLNFGAGIVLPLNLDFYLPITSASANNGLPFVNSLGTLDGAGSATAAFAAPGGLLPPSVIGLTASHAYLTFEGSVLTSASNYTTLEFRP